jgi:glutamate-5-semialdehyde dehydrogenase
VTQIAQKPADKNLAEIMSAIGTRARAAAQTLALASTQEKDASLQNAASALRAAAGDIIAANQRDLAEAEKQNVGAARLDRIMLDEARLEAIACAVEAIITLPDPVGTALANWQVPSGLDITRVRVPLGVAGVIYESRPNVTADAAALCLKAGNAVILRGSSEIVHSAQAIHGCFSRALGAAGLDPDGAQLVPSTDRAAVGMMLGGLDGNIDVIVPRGGKNLVGRVQDEARVPVFAHLEGICHVYVHGDAALGMAREIVINAKMRRTGICGAAETLLVDKACAASHLAPIVGDLLDAGCEVRGCAQTCAAHDGVQAAADDDWGQEFLGPVIAVRVVDGLDAAMAHIARFGSNHTDAIITANAEAAIRFFNEVDSAIVMHNCSTQFADGGEFGMGAEIGIATGRFHARGPVGLEQLTSFKYAVRGNGQVRPK